ncbi:ethanolamine utilization protein EutA [Halopelagius inordinatus]|uniref:Ethanolamine utilization protein EutA n=1 Tax=Halopelagius inordinatus TaxID=553467 RepID=A0A1I2VF36_9EURY|nr:ethanolamine ammonia-lyase reactivating factor EutA [Halopelagius inordinatus]SFG87955.1 ethanolamine utilization protein EutA [Halopelagius inordinatus]
MSGSDPATLTSVGIDVGTTTTQLVVSELSVSASGIGAVAVEIGDVNVVYRGEVHETPLLDRRTLDVDAVEEVVESELRLAGHSPSSIDSGAVIVTGESAYKRNAEELVNAVAEDSGDFVVAAAGPELESVLAGKGSGAAAWAADGGRTILNVDVGGGTTNMCLFSGEEAVETRCLSVGGRLLRFDESGVVTRISPPAERLCERYDVDVAVGSRPSADELSRLATAMTDAIFDVIRGGSVEPVTESLTIGASEYSEGGVDAVAFSGGVGRLASDADRTPSRSPFEFGDFGVFLASAIRERIETSSLSVRRPDEDIRATVIGAGTRTTSFSGTTTHVDRSMLPVKNLPVVEAPPVEVSHESEEIAALLRTCFDRGRELYDANDETPFVLYLPSVEPLSYDRIVSLARAIARAYETQFDSDVPRIVLTRQNCAKALGQQLQREGSDAPSLVVDEIAASDGDYLDIGRPVSTGEAVPVVVKSLAFGA